MAIDTYNTQKTTRSSWKGSAISEIFSTPAGSWNGMNPRFPHVRFAEAPASCAEDGHTVTRAYRQHAPNAGAVQGYM